MVTKSLPSFPTGTPVYQNQFHSTSGVTVVYPNFWSRHHPIEEDGLCYSLYQYLHKSVKGWEEKLSSVYLPETIVFEHNFPRAWYYYDEDNKSISKRPSRMLDVQSMCRVFGTPIEGVDVVAQFFYATVPTSEAWDSILSRQAKKQTSTCLSRCLTYVEFFTVDGLKDFLQQQHRKPDGVLQRFVLPKGEGSARKNSQMQVLWSPLVTCVYKRTNYHHVNDRMVSIPARLSTYDGPPFYSYESVVADDTKICLAGLCENMVRHFLQVEKKQIARMLLYFKIDDRNRIWFLWCSSVRVQADSFNPSTLRIPPSLDQRTEVLNDESSTVAKLLGRRHRQKHLLELDYHLFEATRDIEFALNINTSHRRQAKILGMGGMPNVTPKKGSRNPCYDSQHPLHDAFRCLCDGKDDPFVTTIDEHLNEVEHSRLVSPNSYLASTAGDFSMTKEPFESDPYKVTDAKEIVIEELIELAMDAWYARYSATLSMTPTSAPTAHVVLAEPLLSALSTEEIKTLVGLLGLRPINMATPFDSAQPYEVSPLVINPGQRLGQPSLQVEGEVRNFFKILFDVRGEEITQLCMTQFAAFF